MRTMLIKG